jgi:hypothetical protein
MRLNVGEPLADVLQQLVDSRPRRRHPGHRFGRNLLRFPGHHDLAADREPDDVRPHCGQVVPEPGQHLRRDPLALAEDAQQDVLSADVVVAQLERLAQREFQHLLRARRERDMAAQGLLAGPDDRFDLLAA